MQYSISSAISLARQHLAAGSDIPELEAEVLLAHVLNKSRTFLHTWPEKELEIAQQHSFFELVEKRSQGQPIAYLTGRREFWSLDLVVTPDVLIPRPETELLVELLVSDILRDQQEAIIADLGTGSGAIALAVAREKPSWTIHAVDASAAALEIAKINGSRNAVANVVFHHGDWCYALPTIKFNAIVSNPPYIAEDDRHLRQAGLAFEPRSALVSAENGLKDISEIIFQARDYLVPGGVLLIEHGFQQAKNVSNIFQKAGYTDISIHKDLAELDRVTIASWKHF